MGRKGKRYFGSTRTLPSGRVQARYTGPDGQTYTGRSADGPPADLRFRAVRGCVPGPCPCRHPGRTVGLPRRAEARRPPVLRDYGAAWLGTRDLADRTRGDYAQIMRDHIDPAFGDVLVTAITPAAVREWHARLRTATGPTMRAHAYGLLRTIMNTAVADEVIVANPCRVRGGGTVRRAKTIRPATLPELEALVSALPGRYRLMALLAAWCALRFGELAELRRSDIDVANCVIHIRRGVVRIPGGRKVKDPKSQAGKRDVNIPPHLMPDGPRRTCAITSRPAVTP